MKRRVRWDRVVAIVAAVAMSIAILEWISYVPEPTPEQWDAYLAYVHAQKVELQR